MGGGKSRKSGGVSRALINRLVGKGKTSGRSKTDKKGVLGSGKKSKPDAKLLDE